MTMPLDKKSTKKNTEAGFTLLEILLVVAAIAILAGIVILALNPSKQLGDTRNAQRRSDIRTILDAVYQYSIDNNGTLPTIPISTCALDTEDEVCKATATGTCSAGVDLSVLTTGEKYLTSMPIDPSVSSSDGTGYYIVRTANSRVTVCAPSAEQGATIKITR
ncbi:MAG: type II secretion system protein [bacterium]|nr:type II secretion system protein [bacterium]